jgi:MFS family permease
LKDRTDDRAGEVMLIAALCLVVTVAYGALYYGYAVLITEPAAGSEFSRGLLSAAYGGAVVTGGIAAVPVGRIADRHGVRGVMAAGAVIGAIGLLWFASASGEWQVLAAWWVLLGPATAMCFYEPAYVAIQQAFAPESRARAIGVLTLTAGLSGPIFTPATSALVDALGWRDTTRLLAATMLCAAPLALLFIRVRPGSRADEGAPARDRRSARETLRQPHVLLFTFGAVLAYGAVEAVVLHRVARFQELGFGLGTVALWVGLSGLLTLPGRFVLPSMARRFPPAALLAGVLGVLGLSTALMISGGAYWQMIVSFALFGLVFGAALPLRALIMGEWIPTVIFGAVMGIQAGLIAFGRAGLPALTGGLHDALDGYAAAIALLSVLLLVSAALVSASAARAHRRSLVS